MPTNHFESTLLREFILVTGLQNLGHKNYGDHKMAANSFPYIFIAI